MIEDILYDGVSLPSEAEYALNRPRIDDLLEKALQRPLVTVIAGAGYGKTQAVSQYLETIDQHVIWCQISELDNGISRFWERIVYGFRPYSQELSDSLKAFGYPETIAAFNKFLHLLAKTMANSRPFVIVLDDFYLIHNQGVLNFFENMIAARIQNLSIVLISRVKPNLNFAGMFTKGLVSLITEEELRLSLEETKTYFDQQDLALNDQTISDIYHQTEGWVLATYLIGLSIKKGNAYSQSAASLIDIYALIEHEIFAAVPPKLQRLLLKLGLLDVVPRGLLIELTGHDEELLQEMSRHSLLMRHDIFSDSYHIHHLFKDFLLSKKHRLSVEQVVRVHQTAAHWYEENGHKPEAISHYLKCNDYDKVFDIMLSLERRLPQGMIEFLITVIEQAPPYLLLERPIMQVVKALYLFISNHIDQAYEGLIALQGRYEALPGTEETRSILGEVYILLALISIVRQTEAYEALFRSANACLPHGSALVDHRLNIAEGINITGIKDPLAGALNKKRDTMLRAMPFASKVMNGCCYGAEYLNAADTCYMTGDIRGAEKNAYEAIFFAKQKQQYGIEFMANFILARVYIMGGDYPKVVSILKQMKEQINTLQIGDAIPLYDIIKGWVYLKIGQIGRVPQWIRQEEEAKKQLSPVIVGREYLVRTDSLLAEERYHELLAFMTQTDILYAQRGILYAVIQNKITRAILYHYMGSHADSVRALNEAYALSSPNNLIIQYIEYGHQMRTVISAAKRSEYCEIPLPWLDAIYTKSSAYAKQLSHVALAFKNEYLPETKGSLFLSKREKEVLICLSNGLTRSEIADSFHLSINTVKSILQSVYSKLGASNSVDAVRIATRMELIDSAKPQK